MGPDGQPVKGKSTEKALPTSAAQKIMENQQNLRRAEQALALVRGEDVKNEKGEVVMKGVASRRGSWRSPPYAVAHLTWGSSVPAQVVDTAGDVALGVIGQVGEQRRIDRLRRGDAEQQGLAVRRQAPRVFRRRGTARAGAPVPSISVAPE